MGGSDWLGFDVLLARAEATAPPPPAAGAAPLLATLSPVGGSGANGPPDPMLMYLVAPRVWAWLRAKS